MGYYSLISSLMVCPNLLRLATKHYSSAHAQILVCVRGIWILLLTLFYIIFYLFRHSIYSLQYGLIYTYLSGLTLLMYLSSITFGCTVLCPAHALASVWVLVVQISRMALIATRTSRFQDAGFGPWPVATRDVYCAL